MEYLAYAFDHTLSGPFNKLLSVWFSASQTLCTAHFLFLSPLQRFEVLLCYLIIALLYNAFSYLSSVIFIIFLFTELSLQFMRHTTKALRCNGLSMICNHHIFSQRILTPLGWCISCTLAKLSGEMHWAVIATSVCNLFHRQVCLCQHSLSLSDTALNNISPT